MANHPTDHERLETRIWGLRNVSSRQRLILLALCRWHKMYASELEEVVRCSRPSLMNDLNALVERGYVVREHTQTVAYSLIAGGFV